MAIKEKVLDDEKKGQLKHELLENNYPYVELLCESHLFNEHIAQQPNRVFYRLCVKKQHKFTEAFNNIQNLLSVSLNFNRKNIHNL